MYHEDRNRHSFDFGADRRVFCSMKPLVVAADMYGCPNRCLHCWLGHMPNRVMESGADSWIVDKFRPYFDKITFFSWLREPDFCPDYRARWERDKALCVNAVPPRFELASFWCLARESEYAAFLKQAGVGCVQLTFFGGEQTTDKYVGRKGAFKELLKATDVLLEHGISPRWQAFINEENKGEIAYLLSLSEELELKRRAEAFKGVFRFFVHAGSCDGENQKLYGIRICRQHIPRELIPYYLDYDKLFTERELCEMWAREQAPVLPHNENDIVIYVSNTYDLFFNFTHMRPEWKIGNLKTDPIGELVRRIVQEDIPALRKARDITLGELTRRYGDKCSDRVFEPEDYRMYLLNRHLA